jgi:hypothetical protein
MASAKLLAVLGLTALAFVSGAHAVENITSTTTYNSSLYEYPLVSDKCVLPTEKYATLLDVKQVQTVFGKLGNLPCAKVSDLQACAAETNTLDGCCSTSCANVLMTIHNDDKCRRALEDQVCATGFSTAGEPWLLEYMPRLSNVMYRCVGGDMRCHSSSNVTDLYPLVYDGANCPVPTVIPKGQEFNQSTFDAFVSSASAAPRAASAKKPVTCQDVYDFGFQACAYEVSKTEGCCAKQCAQVMDVAVEAGCMHDMLAAACMSKTLSSSWYIDGFQRTAVRCTTGWNSTEGDFCDQFAPPPPRPPMPKMPSPPPKAAAEMPPPADSTPTTPAGTPPAGTPPINGASSLYSAFGMIVAAALAVAFAL